MDPLSFVGGSLPAGFERRTVTLGARGARTYEPGEWRDALVVVEQGVVELECLGGSRRRFETGAVLCFASLSLRALHNPGRAPTLLVAVSRISAATDESAPPSTS